MLDRAGIVGSYWVTAWPLGVVWAFIAAFAFTIINQPPLPEVDVQGTPSVEGGRLLAHTDGFWYIYNNAGDLIAIRDDNVKSVTYKSER